MMHSPASLPRLLACCRTTYSSSSCFGPTLRRLALAGARSKVGWVVRCGCWCMRGSTRASRQGARRVVLVLLLLLCRRGYVHALELQRRVGHVPSLGASSGPQIRRVASSLVLSR
jgi:hypothetical protein